MAKHGIVSNSNERLGRHPARVAGLVCASVMLLCTIVGISPLVGQDPVGASVQALRMNEESEQLDLDGLLVEEAWQRALAVAELRQREPDEGAPASAVTEVRVLYDAAHLYVGLVLRDSQPDRVIARILERDAVMEANFGNLEFAGDDAVAILLDPFHDHRNAFVFAANANGAQFDALITDEGREINADWRGIWRVAATRTEFGWTAEFAIPFRTLRFPDGDGLNLWGFNVSRMIRNKNEEVLLSAWGLANEGLSRVSRAGHLVGLEDLPRGGASLETTPYVLSGVSQATQGVGAGLGSPNFKVGFDTKYEVRPGVLLDLTVNTDFAQVEADDEQVNLTRFPLFFPEKRGFFLENAGIFQFGDASRGMPPFLLFFSRRIGHGDDGEVPVLAGGRLTGRMGAQTFGFLNVVTDQAFGNRRTNFAVARLKRDVGSSGYVGGMITDRRDARSWNTTAGIDGSFWPTGSLNVEGFYARTMASREGGEDVAYKLSLNYQTSGFGVAAKHLYIGADPEAGMGFITRSDIRETWVHTRTTTNPNVIGIRRLEFYTNSNVITRSDGALQDWRTGGNVFSQWDSGEYAFVWHGRGFTRLDEGFDLTDGVHVPAGDYDTWEVMSGFSTSTNRPLVVGLRGSVRRFYGGRLLTASGDLSLRPNANLALTFNYSHNNADVSGGAFTADIISARLTYAFSTRLFVRSLMQYNRLDNSVSTNIRVNFIHRPGSDLFFVYTEGRGADAGLWHLASRNAAMKLTYLMRF